jgi:hypothetical protein
MKFLLASMLAGSAAAFTPSSSFQGNSNVAHRSASKSSLSMETGADLAVLGKKLNPIIGKFDPLGLAEYNFWGTTEEETIGFLRESEVKHGRIAMFAFVGYIVHANGITWPWPMTLSGEPFPKVSSAPEAWDAIPEAAKWQIILFIGFLEFYNEVGNKHYMKGGKIGDFPDFDPKVIPGGALNYYDPFGWHKNRSEEDKANGLVKEINNGRAAMLGIIAFLSEAKAPGAVPALKGVIPAYSGEPMAPFDHSIFPSL